MKKQTTLEKWIETRLFNLKVQQTRIDIDDMIAEVSGIFKVEMTEIKARNLKKKIQFINNRVAKKYQRYRERIKELSQALNVPENFIRRWYTGGMDLKKSKHMKLMLLIIRERDFYYSMKNDIDFSDLPEEDMKITIEKIFLRR